MQSGEHYVLKVPSKDFFLAEYMLDGQTFGRREDTHLSRVSGAAVALCSPPQFRNFVRL